MTPSDSDDRAIRRAMEGERKQVTVLFVDVVGSMALEEPLDPEEWRRIMRRFFAILQAGVHRVEGTIDKFTGDGAMALFGAPVAHEDHARRACHAALDLQAQIAAFGRELELTSGLEFAVRMGLNSGEVVVGEMGDDIGMAYTAMGHTVGLAKRMEQLAEPGTVYIAEPTAALVEGYFDLQDLGPFQVKGATGSVGVYELGGVSGLRTSIDVARSRGFSRFVGRDEEMALLERALQRTAAGEPQVIGLVAEPGVGKSRLCAEFADHCIGEGVEVVHGHALAHTRGVPFVTVLGVLRDYFGITEQDTELGAREKIAGRLLLLDAAFEPALGLIYDFLGVEDPETAPHEITPEERQHRLFALITAIVRARAAQGPGVILIEDLHWIDPASEAFVQQVVAGLPGSRTLVVLNFRPEYDDGWARGGAYQRLPLFPLGAAAAEALLADLLGDDPSLDGLPELIRERTDGNPFFIEEVVQGLAETGGLTGERGARRLTHTIGEVRIPATVKNVLSARIDRLPERDKHVVQTAAVLGRSFSEAVLRRVVDVEEADLGASLDALVGAGFVYEQALFPDREYRFKHPLTEEVALHSQVAERRAAVHAAVADTIITLYPETLDERAALIAHHWEAAGEPVSAAEWHARAAVWAATADPLSSLAHWRRVRDLSDAAAGDQRAAVQGLTARAMVLHIGWRLGTTDDPALGATPAEVDDAYRESRRFAEAAGERSALSLILSAYATVRGVAGGIDEYLTLALEGQEAAADDAAVRMATAYTPVYAFWCAGRIRESLDWAERAIAAGRAEPGLGVGVLPDNVDPLGWVLMVTAGIHAHAGDLDRAHTYLSESLERAEAAGATEIAAYARAITGMLAGFGTEPEAALDAAGASVEFAERAGNVFARVSAQHSLGIALLANGRPADALAALERSLALQRERNTGREYEPWTLAKIAEARLACEDRDGALATAHEAVAVAQERGMQAAEVWALLALGRVEPDAAAASATLERALAVSAASGTSGIEPQIRTELVERSCA